jgi:hypothetical protein
MANRNVLASGAIPRRPSRDVVAGASSRQSMHLADWLGTLEFANGRTGPSRTVNYRHVIRRLGGRSAPSPICRYQGTADGPIENIQC